MTKSVQQPSSSGADQPPSTDVSELCGGDQQQSPQSSSTPTKGTATVKRSQTQSNRRTSTRLTSIRNDSFSSSSSSSSSSSLSSAGDLDSGMDAKPAPDEDVFKVPSSAANTTGGSGILGEDQSQQQQETGIICRLPLDRLQAILGALNILKGPPDSSESPSSSGSPSPTYKLLCLYCDRTFTSQSLMTKHTDRVHRIPKDRRSSSRVVPTTSDGAFPSCHYCNKGKVLNPASEDLSQLFKHLVDEHSDRYFACEACALRFPSDETRDAHMESLHPAPATPETRTRPKSKAALKSFNLKSTKKTEIITTPLTIQVDFDTEAIKNLTIENIESVDSLSAALGLPTTSTSSSTTRLRSSGRAASARSSSAAPASSTSAAKSSKMFKRSDKMMMRSSEPMLSRLGIAQHRTPRLTRRTATGKARRKAQSATATAGAAADSATAASCSSSLSGTSSSQPDNHYNKITKLKTIRSTLNNPSGSSETDFVVVRGNKNDIVNSFDEDFYELVNVNVRQNLSCHLDGKLEASSPNAPLPMSPVVAVPAIRSTVAKSPLQAESKIHEATNLPALTVFPTLLTVDQFGTDLLPSSKMKKPITKNSWKWKWDFVKKYKYVNENGKIVKKVKQPTLGLRDLSKLDMWTQLSMRTKHELIRNRRSLTQPGSYISEVGDSLRQEQRKQVDELNQILDARLLPQINLEQHDQSVIKLEAGEPAEIGEYSEEAEHDSEINPIDEDFISSLQLLKLPNAERSQQVVLSGEWARPRCYICYCCGDKFNSLKQMEEHKTFRHPYVYSTYYEIVGRELIEKQLFKHFFIPLSALTMHRIHYARLSSFPSFGDRRFLPARQPSSESAATITEIKSEDSSSNEATSFSTTTTSSSSLLSISANTAASSSSSSSVSSRSVLDMLLSAGNDYTTSFTSYPSESGPVQCSKCKKECVNTLVLYAHILNCTNDYIWLQAKKRMKYRRANRRRKGCNRAAMAARKAQMSVSHAVEKSETASNHSGADADSSSCCGSSGGSEIKKKPKPSPPRPRENDSDIVKRLTANLPPKRVSRQILQMTKQIRKRPQMAIVKGKKGQVVSTLAPSKAGVPRGAGAVAFTKLRSGKIAAMPSTNKRAPQVQKAKPPKVEAPTEGDSREQQTEEVQHESEENTKEEPLTGIDNSQEEQKEEQQQHQQPTTSLVKKKKVVPRGRILPVRGNAFMNRAVVQWKGSKKKVLPFRKGLASNSRTLRSGVVKTMPVGNKKRVSASEASPKKEEPVEEEKEKESPTSTSPPASCAKKNTSKRKGSKSPVETKGNVSETEEEERQQDDKTIEKQVSERVKESEVVNPVKQKSQKVIEVEKDGEDKIETVDEEVPKDSLPNEDTGKDEVKSTKDNKIGITDKIIANKEEDLSKRNKEEAPVGLKATPEETSNKVIITEPVTPVKSPSANSQPPSAPSTPSCLSSQQAANKRKPKKLNDCIAMLTGKLSEKLGVDFFNQNSAKNAGSKNVPPSPPQPSVETRASKQAVLPAPPSLLPILVPPITVMPLQITPPQLAPLPLVMNTRHSPAAPPAKPQMLSPVAPIVTPMEEISDEPLNLSKNSPIGRTVPPRNTRDMYNHQNAAQHLSPPPQSPTALHSPHSLPAPQGQQSLQPQQMPQQPGPSTSSRNMPTIKLPPGLIIERVEYKSRPIISKEAPSVTIVARRQPPPSVEGRSAALEPPPSPQSIVTRRQSIQQQQQQQQQQQHQQQLYGDPRKITPLQQPQLHQQPPQQQQHQQLPSPKLAQPAFPPTPSITSSLRQERPLENRISVTITEAKGDRHQSSIAKQPPPVTLNIPERQPLLDRIPPTINPTPLIIPNVPIPVVSQHQSSSSSTTSSTTSSSNSKRSRRKSVYVAPASVADNPSPAPPAQISPAAVPPPPFLSALPHLPFLSHSLLTAPPHGLDLQRLAAIGLPPHLKPPIIPPLTVPAPSAATSAAAAAFLHKLLMPNPDVMVKQIESACAAVQSSSLAPIISPAKKSTEEVVPVIDVQVVQSVKDKTITQVTTPPAPPSVEKKSRSRAKSSKAKAQQSVIVSPVPQAAVLPPPVFTEPQAPIPTEVMPSLPYPQTEAATLEPCAKASLEPIKEKTPPPNVPHEKPTESLLPDKTQRDEQSSVLTEDPKTLEQECDPMEPPLSSATPNPTASNSKTVRKRRKNELASILSDQLLESFKEVDQNALQDLKMMHDMSCEKPDVKFSLEQIPQLAKRKVNIRNPDLLAPPTTRHSPVAGGTKKTATSKKGGAKEQMPKDQPVEEEKAKEQQPIQEVIDADKNEPEKVEDVQSKESENFVASQKVDIPNPTESVTDVEVKKPTIKKNVKKVTEKETLTTANVKDSLVVETVEKAPITADITPTPPPIKTTPNRRTRKLSIDIERLATLDRKGRQNLKAKYSKELESLDIAEKLLESPVEKKTKSKTGKKTQPPKSSEDEPKQEEQKIIEVAKLDDKSVEQLQTIVESIPIETSSKKKSYPKSRSKTPFPFPKEQQAEKTDLDRLKESLNIETPTKKPKSNKKKQATPIQEPLKEPEEQLVNQLEPIAPPPASDKKTTKRKSGKVEKEQPASELSNASPNKKNKEEIESQSKLQTKRSKTPAPEVEEKPRTPSPAVTPIKKSKTPAPQEKQKSRTPSPAVSLTKTSKTAAPQIEKKVRSPSPCVTPTKKPKAPTPPKRIMQRRSSVYVDRNLAQYLEERDTEQELLSNSSFKDDLILTSRRGTRSQGTVDLDLIASFAEAAMKPRDPRRRSAAAVAAAAASAKRAEEERKAAEEERKRRETEEKLRLEESKRLEEEEKQRQETAKPTPVLRRISARRASLFVASPPEIEEPKAPEENIAEISKATKRQYRRRASVYQPMSFLDEEEQMEKQKQEASKSKTANAVRSKTPGPGGIWDQDIRSVGRRRNTSSVFNGTPEPTIESLLEPLSLPTSGTKRRTKNSQLAENLSKLFNLEEESQLIDQSKRKFRKTNTPVAFELGVAHASSTPLKESRESLTDPKESPIVETKKIDVLVKVVEKEVAKVSGAPKPRESFSFSNDDEDETPKLNKLVEDIINKSESESDSDDDNMSLACFVRREESFLKPNQQQFHDTLEAIGEDESNSAMDDDMSVTTEVTTFGGSIKKRKRRKSICVTKSRRPKPPVDENKPIITYNCDLCKKVFKKQDAYNKHRMTLSHIAKLSEQEYLEAQQKERQAVAAAVNAPTTPQHAVHASPPKEMPSGSSPPKDIEKDSSMKTLSQEEKLFYECCSMLKESNADNENLNLTVSLKSDEMAPTLIGNEIPPPKVSVTYPNPFASLPQQDKTATDNNCFNMGDSFPSFQDVSESENYIQTINQRLTDPFVKLTAAGIAAQQESENDGNVSPQNSTKSTSSQASVFSSKTVKTKGALKGYDNFKVSIPMSGLQLAKESKLDTLADIALCGDIPKEFDLKDTEEEEQEETSKISHSSEEQATSKSEALPKNGLQSNTSSGRRAAAAKKGTQGNKLGFRAKKKGATTTSPRRVVAQKKATVKSASTKSNKPDPDDIYAFQDSPPEESETLPLYSSNKKHNMTSASPAITNKSGTESQEADQGEDSQMSSLSFSDRDDFVYGTNTLSEDEDDKSSSYSSTQTTPKKPIKADVQKKSLIMGRIFKKAKDKTKDETGGKKTVASGNEDQAKPAAKDFDKLFDTLKKSDTEEKTDKEETSGETELSTAEMDPKLFEEYEEDEKGNRKLRRRSTQKKLTETWDSDEYEDFNLNDVVGLIGKKGGKVANKKTQKETDESEKESSKIEEKLEESPLKIVNQPAKEQTTTTAKAKQNSDKKSIVTDETIRQVMESVIMEVSMNKNSRTKDNKRRPKGRVTKTASLDSTKEDENVPEKTQSKDSSSDGNSSIEEHVLEASVQISSKTITTKFKQKLNSQATKQKQQPQHQEQEAKTTQEESKKSASSKTVNNNNQKSKVTPKAKEQRKETQETGNKGSTISTKVKQRKGPPKKMKNVAYDPDSDFEDNIKCKKVKKKLLESDIEANLKIEQLNALNDSLLMPAPRRKRNAAETLYFWSSSSEEDQEEDFVEVPASKKSIKKKKGAARQKQTIAQQSKAQQKQQQQQNQTHQKQQADSSATMEAGDDTSSSSEHMQQHGWIVGDSHKKLVTLLAHAKGKQDNRPVKATGNRRKS